ncbi:Uncharacterised protein [Mycobacteroides abscessus subsp. abscessus]|nr:Uncharacterised protein [Mycobacteroides abscessus subsp. abscessus]
MVAGKEATPEDIHDTEKLKLYWTKGEGAIKIGWGTPGDFNRCLTNLEPYLKNPEMTKGYCANLHHMALGIWPAEHAKLDKAGH